MPQAYVLNYKALSNLFALLKNFDPMCYVYQIGINKTLLNVRLGFILQSNLTVQECQ